jgi:DNA-binding IclR family transcriptional regulator
VSHFAIVRSNANTSDTPPGFRRELQKVQRLGYAEDKGEESAGINCVGAPVFDRSGFPVASEGAGQEGAIR